MKRMVSGSMLISILFCTFALTANTHQIGANITSEQKEEQLAKMNMAKGQARITEHKINTLELSKLRQLVGVSQRDILNPGVIDGHGMGLRAPTEEDWGQIAVNSLIVENISLGSAYQLSSRVDHSASPWFPPIGDQDGESSCLAWAIGYYMKTFQEAREHGWNLTNAEWKGKYPTPEYQDRIISPAFIYHLTNWGINSWTYYYTVISLVCSIGACTWAKMPWNSSDHATWPSEDAWREAAFYRGASTGYEEMFVDTDDGILSLKNWIASDNLAVIGVDCGQYPSLTSDDVWTTDNYAGGSNHANTIVGYDDNLTYLEDGQLAHGAFKVANSWGVGGWEKVPDGFYWVSYKAMSQKVGYVMFCRDRIGYVPTLTSSFRIEHSMRGECDVVIGMGTHDDPNVSKCFNDYVCGGNLPFCPNDIVFDISEFKDVVPNVYDQSFFIRVYDGETSATGTILDFAVEKAVSKNPPVTTVNDGFVFADLILATVLHDIGIKNLTTLKTIIGLGYNTNTYMKIVNYGISSETLKITMYADTSIIATLTDFNLAGLNSTTLLLIWNTTSLVYGNYTLSAYVKPIPGETDIADNRLSNGWVFVSIPGDVNGDRKVDLKDVYTVGKGFSSTSGPDGLYWHSPAKSCCPHSPNCDINDDGKIDLKDYYTTGKNYSKSW